MLSRVYTACDLFVKIFTESADSKFKFKLWWLCMEGEYTDVTDT